MIVNRGIFDASYEVTRQMARRGDVPLKLVPSGTLVFRSVAASYKGVAATPDSARTIFNGVNADNRWSGSRPTGPGVGALYVSLHLDAVSNELFYYADRDASLPRNPDLGRILAQDALKGRQIFRFEVTDPLMVAELSLESPRGREFVVRLGESHRLKPVLAAAGYATGAAAYQAPNDYSFARGVGLAIADELTLAAGLEVVTARDEWAKIGDTGNNLALFGPDGAPLRTLRPVSVLSFGIGPRGELQQTVTRLP
jgi:hypothetical protein